LNELVAVCQFPLSANSGKPIAATNHKLVSTGTGKFLAMNVNGLSFISSLQRASHGYEKATYFGLGC
jgi:hypothetical protein